MTAVLFDNLLNLQISGSYSYIDPTLGNGQSFWTTATDHAILSLSVVVKIPSPEFDTTLTALLYSDAGNAPAVQLADLGSVEASSLSYTFAPYTFTFPRIDLAPSSQYWIVLETRGGGEVDWDFEIGPAGARVLGAHYLYNDRPSFPAIDRAFFMQVVACYCRGVRILTERGETAVEDLAIGDRVVTLDGALKPIRFLAGSLGGGLPRRDLRVSPEHAMWLDGARVPARHLVNGRTIVQEQDAAEVEYFHIELDAHDVIFAEAAPSETYRDEGNRGIFQNAAEFARLYREGLPAGEAFAPRLDGGPALAAIRAWLDDGESEDLFVVGAGRQRFCVRPGAAAVRLVSASGFVSPDQRRLGAEGGWRWTDGAAVIAVAGARWVEIEVQAAPFRQAA